MRIPTPNLPSTPTHSQYFHFFWTPKFLVHILENPELEILEKALFFCFYKTSNLYFPGTIKYMLESQTDQATYHGLHSEKVKYHYMREVQFVQPALKINLLLQLPGLSLFTQLSNNSYSQ